MISTVMIAVLLSLAPQASTGSISGVVVGADNTPLRRVTVTVAGDARVTRTTITDDRGVFAATDLPAGRYTVSATKGGYARATFGAERPSRPGTSVALAAGQQVTGISLKMRRGGVITGRVTDEAGEPLPGVRLTLHTLRVSPSGDRTLRPAPDTSSAVADDRGAFRFFGLAPGEYIVGVMSSPVSSARVPTDTEIRDAFEAAKALPAQQRPVVAPPVSEPVNFAQIYSGDTPDPTTATLVAVGSGEERSIDIRMRRAPMATVAITVIGADGLVRTAETSIVKQTAISGSMSIPANASGIYEFRDLAPYDYTVMSRFKSPDGRMLVATQEVSAHSGVNPGTLTLAPAPTMAGRVVFRGEASPPDPTTVAIAVEHVERALAFNRVASPTIAPDGSFALTGMMPGRHRASASVRSNAQWVLESIKVGDRDVTDEGFVVREGAPVEAEFIFTTAKTELTGVLQHADSSPAPEYFVAAFAADEALWSSPRRLGFTRPDINGRYTFSGLPPGSYRLAVTTDMERADLGDVAFIRALLPGALEVTLTSGEKRVLDLAVK